MSFMQVDHTRCLVDGHFGLMKKIYRQSDTDALSEMAEVVHQSNASNTAQLYDWQWCDWDTLFQCLTKDPTDHQILRFRFLLQLQVQFTFANAGLHAKKGWDEVI